MKKYFVMVLACMACMLMISLSACDKSKADSTADTNSAASDKAADTNSAASDKAADANKAAPAKGTDDAEAKRLGINHPVREVFKAAYASATGAYATITIDPKLKMDQTAWVGLCPTGKDYYNEREADDVDVIYYYPDSREEGDKYVFACDFSSVEDGTYALVVATSDDENVGYIAIQLEMTKTGDSISFDYTNAKLNKAPSK